MNALSVVLLASAVASADAVAQVPLNTNAAEVVAFFARNVYGERPDLSDFKKTCSIADRGVDSVLRAHRRDVALNVMTPWGETNFTAVSFEPEHPAGTRVPCFVYLSFQRPAEMLARPDDRSLKPWRWPVKDILARGFATVAFYYEDVFPDDSPSVCDWGRSSGRSATGWGAISTWALAASRVMDWIETTEGLDASKVAVVGHSRLGKTALWTGATDGRFAYAVVNDSGCMGARMSTRNLPGGETIEIITTRFPHWFAPTCASQFAGRDAQLPFDQHWLLASLAPRLVAVGSAEDDHWACPSGEHASIDLARPAWGENRGRCHYHIRPGGHDITPVDWADYMDFAERHGWRGTK